MSDQGHGGTVPDPDAALLPDRFEREILELITQLTRRPINPTLDNELLADLGFDSLHVLELVGEIEDHFNIAVPLNDLTHIRTVGQIVEEVRRLALQGPDAIGATVSGIEQEPPA